MYEDRLKSIKIELSIKAELSIKIEVLRQKY